MSSLRSTLHGVVWSVWLGLTVCPSLADGPIGLEAIERFDLLGQLRQGVRTEQVSSHDPAGDNADWGNYRDVIGNEQVLLDVAGPGCVYRIWLTGHNPNGYIRVYFDQSTTPLVNLRLADFFSGTVAPFLTPLVNYDLYSSGGFFCYLPMPFRTGCRITTTGGGHYYNVTFQRFDSAVGVTTFTGNENSSTARAMWNNAGTDPKPTQGNITLADTVPLPSGATVTLANFTQSGIVNAIEVTLPGLHDVVRYNVTDHGRAFFGYSEFQVALDPANQGVNLTRRMDYGIGDQVAAVYVDGDYVSDWSTPGFWPGAWLDATVAIPEYYTAGKTSITVRIEFVSSAYDWNEFYYWVDSIVGGQPVLTDEVDVGDGASEAAHAYVVSDQTWAGIQTFTYYPGPAPEFSWDDGRAFMDYCEFQMALDPSNTGVRLVRRIDYGINDQRGEVVVDGESAGEWYTPGYSAEGRWLDAGFDIPPALTAGKSSITVRVNFLSSGIDWNEFRYWAYCTVNGQQALTDELDVGNADSESWHAYVISGENWNGWRLFSYYQPPSAAYLTFQEILDGLRLRAHWDGAGQPAVDAPLGGLCGNMLGPGRVTGLAAGIDGDRLYLYFPMPFATSALVELVNAGSINIPSLTYTLRYKPLAAAQRGVGYFHAQEMGEIPTTPGRDYPILDETGAGQFVGVAIAARSYDGWRGYLEGDERIYVDGSLTPQLYGTGNEDFCNGGWYFWRGPFTLPVHGYPLHETGPRDGTGSYRYFLTELIPFQRSLRVGIEHGNVDAFVADYRSVAVYYKVPDALATLTDTLDVGHTASEAAHSYTITGQTFAGPLTATYEGDDDDVPVDDDGRHFNGGYSQFTVALDPYNAGVLLRRRLDYAVHHQRAQILVDGQAAGEWYDAGWNDVHRFRDSEFLIPASLTRGKTSLTLRVQETGVADWTEYRYWLYSIRPAEGIPGDMNCDGVVDFGDIDPFVLALSDQAAYEAQFPNCDWSNGDCNNDGLVDFGDIDPFVALLSG